MSGHLLSLSLSLSLTSLNWKGRGVTVARNFSSSAYLPSCPKALKQVPFRTVTRASRSQLVRVCILSHLPRTATVPGAEERHLLGIYGPWRNGRASTVGGDVLNGVSPRLKVRVVAGALCYVEHPRLVIFVAFLYLGLAACLALSFE